jgi:formylglycine-generating enzyme required for sulfatase activity
MKRIGFGLAVLAIVMACSRSVGAGDNEKGTSVPHITWAAIDDLGFTGQMSKYEITNAQYAQFLNELLKSDELYVDGGNVRCKRGIYKGRNYYRIDGPSFNYAESTDGGKSRISFKDSVFAVNSGFENYPVTFVSWHGAMAFARRYAWRVPTEWEWQAVADFDGSYTYGCGTRINNKIANYGQSKTSAHGVTEVGAVGTYGYGLADMAGNVAEWTGTLWNPEYEHAVHRGGGWYCAANMCEVSHRDRLIPSAMWPNIGFRVCRRTGGPMLNHE